MVIMFMMLIMFTKVSFVLIVILCYCQYFAVLSINQSFVFNAVFQDFYFVTAAQMLFVFVIDIFNDAAHFCYRCCGCLLAGNLCKHTFFESHGTCRTGNAQT